MAGYLGLVATMEGESILAMEMRNGIIYVVYYYFNAIIVFFSFLFNI